MPKKPKEQPMICQHFSWHVRPIKNGIYYADGRINKTQRIDRHSLSTREYTEALKNLRKLDEHMAVKLGIAKKATDASSSDVSVAHGWALYMERCAQPEILGGVSQGTQDRYRPIKNKHIEFCKIKGYSNWSDITRKSANEYGNWLANQKKSDRTIVLELNTICSIVKWLVEEEHLPSSCQFKLNMRKPEGSSTYCYRKVEVARMIAFCHSIPDLNWLALVITALATTGLRINELAKLRWSDIDFESNTLTIADERSRPHRKQTGYERRTKGKRSRTIPINPALRDMLGVIPKSKDGLVFHGKTGQSLSDRRVLEALQQKVIKQLKEEFPTPVGEIGFANGTVHGLRHYFCSEAYRNGATDAELQEWLGHTTSEVMQLYRHLSTEDSQQRMKQINFLGCGDEGD